jgi:hypothetical protein
VPQIKAIAGDGTAKFEINPLKVIENNGMKSKDIQNNGMKSKDIHLAESIIEENTEVIEKRWNEYFGNK